MDGPPHTAVPKPCCVCDGPGKHCTKCKSRHYCSKACQLVDWYERGHKAQCKQLASELQDRLLDELMPENLNVKEEPAIVADVAPADGSKARLPAAGAAATGAVKANALFGSVPDWRETCPICLDVFPVNFGSTFYACCCRKTCKECSVKWNEYDTRCPLCLMQRHESDAEWQKHVDEGYAEAQVQLASAYCRGLFGPKKNLKQTFGLYQLAAVQGHALAQSMLGSCYEHGKGVKIDHTAAVKWYQRVAEQGHPDGQNNFGVKLYRGEGVAQSFGEAVKWLRLAAAQGNVEALLNLASCHEAGRGVPQDLDEALRLLQRVAAMGHADAAAAIETLEARLAATRAG